MKDLKIMPTSKSLGIKCKSGYIELTGCSILNNPNVFFKPLRNWISDYLKNPNKVNVVNIKIEYLDSASTKQIFEILKSIENLNGEETSIKIDWYYDINDPEILEIGEILAGRVRIPFEFIQY